MYDIIMYRKIWVTASIGFSVLVLEHSAAVSMTLYFDVFSVVGTHYNNSCIHTSLVVSY